jgi:hypothetical protein
MSLVVRGTLWIGGFRDGVLRRPGACRHLGAFIVVVTFRGADLARLRAPELPRHERPPTGHRRRHQEPESQAPPSMASPEFRARLTPSSASPVAMWSSTPWARMLRTKLLT